MKGRARKSFFNIILFQKNLTKNIQLTTRLVGSGATCGGFVCAGLGLNAGGGGCVGGGSGGFVRTGWTLRGG